jgi:hypothetical protein
VAQRRRRKKAPVAQRPGVEKVTVGKVAEAPRVAAAAAPRISPEEAERQAKDRYARLVAEAKAFVNGYWSLKNGTDLERLAADLLALLRQGRADLVAQVMEELAGEGDRREVTRRLLPRLTDDELKHRADVHDLAGRALLNRWLFSFHSNGFPSEEDVRQAQRVSEALQITFPRLPPERVRRGEDLAQEVAALPGPEDARKTGPTLIDLRSRRDGKLRQYLLFPDGDERTPDPWLPVSEVSAGVTTYHHRGETWWIQRHGIHIYRAIRKEDTEADLRAWEVRNGGRLSSKGFRNALYTAQVRNRGIEYYLALGEPLADAAEKAKNTEQAVLQAMIVGSFQAFAAAASTMAITPEPPGLNRRGLGSRWGNVSPDYEPPKIQMDKQGKHIEGHKNYQAGKSILTVDPTRLILKAGTGKPANNIPRGQAGYKERVNFGEVIGVFVDKNTGIGQPTTKGIIHYAKDGSAHIVPAKP